MNPPTPFGKRIKAMRDRVGSDRKLALIIGVSPSTVGNWLEGMTPGGKRMREIATRCGVSLEWIRDGKGNEAAELAGLDHAPAPNARDWLNQAVQLIEKHGDDFDRRSLADAIEVIQTRIERRRTPRKGVRYEQGSE